MNIRLCGVHFVFLDTNLDFFFTYCRYDNLIHFRFALQHGGRVLLADEMGLGKTLQVIKYFKPFS